jgi:hypothetical protein
VGILTRPELRPEFPFLGARARTLGERPSFASFSTRSPVLGGSFGPRTSQGTTDLTAEFFLRDTSGAWRRSSRASCPRICRSLMTRGACPAYAKRSRRAKQKQRAKTPEEAAERRRRSSRVATVKPANGAAPSVSFQNQPLPLCPVHKRFTSAKPREHHRERHWEDRPARLAVPWAHFG